MEKKQRLNWLDVSKAFGVYLVILGHLSIFNYHTFRFIFAFHMPFFFIVAGYVFRDGVPLKNFLKKCFKYYLVPYITILILGLLQCVLIPIGGHDLATFISPAVLQKAFYNGHPCFSFFGSAWFLLAMFWAQLMFWGMLKIKVKLKKYIVIMLWILLFFTAIFAKDIFRVIPYYAKLPFKIDAALMATVFMGIGYLLRRIKIFEKNKVYISIGSILIGALFTYLFGCKWNYYVNLCDCDYGIEYNYLIAAVAGSVMLFGLGQLLQKSKLLIFIGRNTLFIFLAHEAIYLFILYCVNSLFEKDFKSQAMPLNGWSIGISFVTLMLATAMIWGYRSIKEIIKKRLLDKRNRAQ